MANYIEPIYGNYEMSFKAFKELLTTDYEVELYPPAMAENTTFGAEFPGALIQKPKYTSCTFINSKFESSDGLLSKFHSCLFNDCFFNNCDLRYCDIFDSSFLIKQAQSVITSCNFSFGNFIDSNFIDTDFTGCSFRQMQLESTSFKHCTIRHCSIEQSSIRNCLFEGIDLRKSGIRYCTFENTVFKAVTFHILDLPRNYGLIQQLQNSTDSIFVAYKNNETMPLSESIDYLRKLIPYYLEKNLFYELVNVYAAYGEFDKIIDVLPFALKNVIATCDFASLLDLCSLIVKMEICNGKQLREFYALIKQYIMPDKFPHYLRKSYNTYIENIKHILVDNPYNSPEANILLKTNINSINDSDMQKLLTSIEVNVEELAPAVDISIQLTHHSPYDVLIVLFGKLPEILMVCQMFYYSLGGAKAFDDLKQSRKEKTVKKDKKRSDSSEKTNNEMIKRIELSIGNVFSFKYEEEFRKRVESLEYTIK